MNKLRNRLALRLSNLALKIADTPFQDGLRRLYEVGLDVTCYDPTRHTEGPWSIHETNKRDDYRLTYQGRVIYNSFDHSKIAEVLNAAEQKLPGVTEYLDKRIPPA